MAAGPCDARPSLPVRVSPDHPCASCVSSPQVPHVPDPLLVHVRLLLPLAFGSHRKGHAARARRSFLPIIKRCAQSSFCRLLQALDDDRGQVSQLSGEHRGRVAGWPRHFRRSAQPGGLGHCAGVHHQPRVRRPSRDAQPGAPAAMLCSHPSLLLLCSAKKRSALLFQLRRAHVPCPLWTPRALPRRW